MISVEIVKYAAGELSNIIAITSIHLEKKYIYMPQGYSRYFMEMRVR